jgi:transposase
MILNELGFVSRPLYMFPQFFEAIACEHLIGAEVKPEYLNDDKLGRVMDKLFMKGLDTTFLTIALNSVNKFNISLSSSHLDSSSMHVHGEYNSSLPEVIFENQQAVKLQKSEELAVNSPKEITLTYGYSRDHNASTKNKSVYRNGAVHISCRVQLGEHSYTFAWRIYMRAKTVRRLNRHRPKEQRLKFKSK